MFMNKSKPVTLVNRVTFPPVSDDKCSWWLKYVLIPQRTRLTISFLVVLAAAVTTGCQEQTPSSYTWTNDQAVSEFEKWAKVRSGTVNLSLIGSSGQHYQCFDYLTRDTVITTHPNKEATGTAVYLEPWPEKNGFGRWLIRTSGRGSAQFRIFEKSGEVELVRGGKGVKQACQLS